MAEGNPVLPPIEERETANKNEDGTRYGNPFEILTPEELEELEAKEKMARIKVPPIPPEMYEELERAMKEGEEDNALEIEKYRKRSVKHSMPAAALTAKETWKEFFKSFFRF